MQKRVLTLCAVFFSVVCAFAQDGADWYIGKSIRTIVFQGLVTVSPNEVNGLVEPYRGKSFTLETQDEIVTMLYGLDYFELITPNALPGDPSNDSVILEFTVVEHPVMG
jgi:outer membrane protein insertion porin family